MKPFPFLSKRLRQTPAVEFPLASPPVSLYPARTSATQTFLTSTMAFTELETAAHLKVLEDSFWSQCRPPAHLRDKIREGQRITGHSIELFFIRPAFNGPGKNIEESIAKIQYVRSRGVWRIFWKRADGKWHGYPPFPEASSLADALGVIQKDAHGCFFG